MKLSATELRQIIREEVEGAVSEDLKNLGAKHEKTVSGAAVLRKIHNAPGVMEALQKIDSPKELAHLLEALLDAVPIVRKADVLRALQTVTRHEKKTRR